MHTEQDENSWKIDVSSEWYIISIKLYNFIKIIQAPAAGNISLFLEVKNYEVFIVLVQKNGEEKRSAPIASTNTCFKPCTLALQIMDNGFTELDVQPGRKMPYFVPLMSKQCFQPDW